VGLESPFYFLIDGYFISIIITINSFYFISIIISIYSFVLETLMFMETYVDLNVVKLLKTFFLEYKIYLTVDVRFDRTCYAQEHRIIWSTFVSKLLPKVHLDFFYYSFRYKALNIHTHPRPFSSKRNPTCRAYGRC
jgi:hypothetical protein